MKRSLHLAFPALLALAAGCSAQKRDASAPWLTMPSLATHTTLSFFPIEPGSVHGPLMGQKLTTCGECHVERPADGSLAPQLPLPAWPQAGTFKVFTCTGCHVEIRPGVFHDDVTQLKTIHGTAANFDPSQALTSVNGVTVFDSSCRTCHPVGWGLKNQHQDVLPLPHGKSAGALIAGCKDCHVTTLDRTQLDCATCHATVDTPPTATAHAAVPGFDPSGSTSASGLCARCHGDGVVPVKMSAHTSFPITTGFHQGASGAACLSCHTASLPAPKAFAADFSLRTDVNSPTCTGCHVATAATLPTGAVYHDNQTDLATFHANAGVTAATGFGVTTAACLGCHPDGAGGAPKYHDQLFVLAAGSSHAGIACSACHAPSNDRTDIANMQCVSCHATYLAGHAPASGVTIMAELLSAPPCTPTPIASFTNAECLLCHGPDLFNPTTVIATHLASGNGAILGQQGQHRSAGCLTCHVATKQVMPTAPTGPTSVYPILDYSQPSPSRSSPGCATCHANACGNGN
jgi:hypothetical protein